MKTLDLADLSRLPEELKAGEPIELREGGRVVARVVPEKEQTIEERIDELVAQGKATKGEPHVPEWFFTDPRPKFEGSLVDQVLQDRRKHDW